MANWVYESQTFRSKLNYQFTRAISARVIVEYDTTLANPAETSLQRTKEVQTQALLTWLPHPGTVFYLGWNNDLQNYNTLFGARQGGLCDPTQPILPRGAGYLDDGRQIFVEILLFVSALIRVQTSPFMIEILDNLPFSGEHPGTRSSICVLSNTAHELPGDSMYRLFAAAAWLALAVPLAPAETLPSPQAKQPQAACAGHTLSGTVQDSTAAVIPGATILIDGTPSQSQTSGSDGRLTSGASPNGPHHITAAASGFATLEQELPVRLPPDLRLTFIPADTVTVNVDAGDSTAAAPLGGLNGATLSGGQLTTLADDPDDLQRELQQLAASAADRPPAP